MALALVLSPGLRKDSEATVSSSNPREGRTCQAGAGVPEPLTASPPQVTVTKPCAPIVTFGIKHSDYMMPLVVDVE